jgi:glycosyltransferase involved in cell wall biosynthesis
MKGKLKSAYELANDRIIVSKYKPKQDIYQEKKRDFVRIAEFADREDKVMESNETRLIIKEDVLKEKETMPIKVKEPEHKNYDEEPIEVHYRGTFMDYSGFSRLNRTMAFGLSNRGIKVKIEIEPHLIHINKATQDELKFLSTIQISPTAPKIYSATVPTDISHAGKKILYTMIETSEKAHPDYVGKLNLTNEIWVPTKYGEKILKQSGVHPPIMIMPLGVDVDRYRPNLKPMNFGSLRGFVFLSVFRWSYRKGYDLLLKAYMEEFSNDEDVSLLMVTRAIECPEEIGEQKIVSDFNDVKNNIKKSEEELPHIALYTKPVKEQDMPRVYNSGNAFVLISRGEGFGIPYLESSSCGLPVIASNCSGHTDFLNKDNSYLVDPDGYVKSEINGSLSRMAKLCRFYENQMFPNFTSTSIEQIKEHMRFVFENYNEAKKKNKKLQALISKEYTWDMAVDRVYNRLKEIA